MVGSPRDQIEDLGMNKIIKLICIGRNGMGARTGLKGLRVRTGVGFL